MSKMKEEWIEAKEAASILSKRNGHTIRPDYVRRLAYRGKIRYRTKDGRTNEYYRADIENYDIYIRGTKIGPRSKVSA